MPEPRPGTPPSLFRDPRGNEFPHDGTSPIAWRVGASLLVERGGRVLMIDSLQSGRWELPGGGVEPEETLAAGAARECFEETGYRATEIAPEPLYFSDVFFTWRGAARHYWHAISVVFRGSVEEEPDPGWTPDPLEVRAVRWMDPADLSPENTQPHHWPALRRAGLV